MVSTVKATAFVKAFRTGRTCPCLMLCEDDKGVTTEVVVKLRMGNECTCTGLICELVASLLARDLSLPAPEPCLVEVDDGFHVGISDVELADRFRASAGINFGSRYLGPAYISWPQLRSIPASLQQAAAETFAFDFIIQNPDRREHKPNLLRKGDELAIFDHEMAFSFLYALAPDEYPWDGKGNEFAKDHIFYRGLKGKEVTWDRMHGALEAIDNARLAMYTAPIPQEWRQDSGDAAERIQAYLELATRNGESLFQKMMEVLI
jgi:hypothetical protein